MGIYIKGMEMPGCGLTVTIYPDGRVVRFLGYGEKKQLGTAIPVPQHGRLIDADALYEKFARLESEAMNALKTTNTGSVNWICDGQAGGTHWTGQRYEQTEMVLGEMKVRWRKEL